MRELIPHSLVILCCCGMLGSCGPASNTPPQTPEIWRKVFQPDSLNYDLAKNANAEEIVALEKCGNRYHPPILFDVASSREYPIPSLLEELRQGENDEWWNEHVVYLIKEVIEQERFHSEVMRDRELIMQEVGRCLDRTKPGKASESMHRLRDGIQIYYLKQDGVEF